jgi:hypothetical protein
MDKKAALEFVEELQKIGRGQNNMTGIYGTTPAVTVIQHLHQAGAKFAYHLQRGESPDESLDELQAALQTAGLIGVLNQQECDGYLQQLLNIRKNLTAKD